VHLFGYDPPFRADRHFNEIRNTNLERNHVVLLLSYSVVKEPTSAKGRQSCQTLTSVSSGLAPNSGEPNPSDADTLTLSICFLEKICGPELLCRLQGPRILRPRRYFVNYRAFHRQPRDPVDNSTPYDFRQPHAPALYSVRLLHNLLCRFELRRVFQRSRTAQGPARTTLPQVLFHRFRRITRNGDEITTRAGLHGSSGAAPRRRRSSADRRRRTAPSRGTGWRPAAWR
jgi:hypothetical protein